MTRNVDKAVQLGGNTYTDRRRADQMDFNDKKCQDEESPVTMLSVELQTQKSII